jgi:ankyrin repeat protein
MTPLVYATTMADRIRSAALEEFNSKTSPMESQIAEATLKKEISQKLTYARAIVEFLVDSGADVNQETPYGTPLMSAATSDWNADIIDYLLQSGAEINQQDHNGRTALFYAAVNDSKEVAIQLLSAGADINIKDNDGKTYMEVTPEEWEKE